jgi:NAD(P)-dependent dehydrogenase (short-subunit alcohol dehydrogenase family)
MIIDFTGKTVLVTGASRGIGRATALLFAESNAKVAVHYKDNIVAAQNTLSLLKGKGHFLVGGDISKMESCKHIIDSVIAECGSIDILINNAGIYKSLDITDCTQEQWQENWNETINANLLGLANLSFFASRWMISKKSGTIVNISSRGAFRGEPDSLAYGASKAAVNSFGQSLAKKLGEHNVFVYTIAPGFVDTEMSADALTGADAESVKKQSPLGRVASAEEVARSIILLAATGNDYMTGCILDVNGASYLRQ